MAKVLGQENIEKGPNMYGNYVFNKTSGEKTDAITWSLVGTRRSPGFMSRILYQDKFSID